VSNGIPDGYFVSAGGAVMLNISATVRIFVSTKPVDMRRSFDGLFELVQSTIQQDPYTGHIFLFRSRRANVVKALWLDLDGWVIFAKRLESGTFQFPDIRFVDGNYEPVEIARADLLMLLEGIDAGGVTRLKRFGRNNSSHRQYRNTKTGITRSGIKNKQ
jgi:transposase